MSKNDNLYIAPKGDYKLIITNKKTKEKAFQSESQNQTNLIQIMDQFPRSQYSRLLTGKDVYLYEG